MSAAEHPPFCAECGLHSPCKTCGGGGKPRLGVVKVDCDMPHWTRAQLVELINDAFSAGYADDQAKLAELVAQVLL